MKPKRIQLHSDLGRAMLLYFAYAPWLMPVMGVLGAIVAALEVGFRPLLLLPMVTWVLLLPLARWALSNSTTVFATPGGLEMPGRRRTVAWNSVRESREIPFIGGLLLNVYRVTFDDGTAPLTFYGITECEQIIKRFKASSQHLEPNESAA